MPGCLQIRRTAVRSVARWAFALAVTALMACSYLVPATWRSFRADPDDAAPSITRALAAQQIGIAKWDPAARKITSDYLLMSDGVDRTRERYVVTWERSSTDGTLVIYVRHEAQEQDLEDGAPTWTARTHDTDKESALLDAITTELIRLHQPLPSKS